MRKNWMIAGFLALAMAIVGGLRTPTFGQTLGTAQQQTLPSVKVTEGSAPSGAAGFDVLWGNSTDHTLSVTPNNGAVVNFPVTVYDVATYTNATGTFSSVTGLSFPVSASRNYHASCRITWQASANTAGPKYQFTGPGSPTNVLMSVFSWVTSSTFQAQSIVAAFSTPYANTGTVTTTTNFTDTVDLALVNGTNAGTVQLQMAANGAGTVTVANGSFCTVQ